MISKVIEACVSEPIRNLLNENRLTESSKQCECSSPRKMCLNNLCQVCYAEQKDRLEAELAFFFIFGLHRYIDKR